MWQNPYYLPPGAQLPLNTLGQIPLNTGGQIPPITG